MTVDNKLKRKLTTIFCADVQGYSTLMATDEAGTLAAAASATATSWPACSSAHDGREVNTWGDGRARGLRQRGRGRPMRGRDPVRELKAGAIDGKDEGERDGKFRIGINLGDVMNRRPRHLRRGRQHRLAGLQSLAVPGGIMVSETVYDLTHKQLGLRLRLRRRAEGQGPGQSDRRLPRPHAGQQHHARDRLRRCPGRIALHEGHTAAFARSPAYNLAEAPPADACSALRRAAELVSSAQPEGRCAARSP